jgi:hypothetical protein
VKIISICICFVTHSICSSLAKIKAAKSQICIIDRANINTREGPVVGRYLEANIAAIWKGCICLVMMNLDMLPASYLEKSSAGFWRVAKLLVINPPRICCVTYRAMWDRVLWSHRCRPIDRKKVKFQCGRSLGRARQQGWLRVDMQQNWAPKIFLSFILQI